VYWATFNFDVLKEIRGKRKKKRNDDRMNSEGNQEEIWGKRRKAKKLRNFK
jgi:hypothetical protein